jgi:ubiquinol-cytochrome c reductase cytochrome c1 subunit
MRKATIAGLALLLAGAAPLVMTAGAAEEVPHPKNQNWSFDGVFGGFDRAQLKRGWQVYKQVCSNCHSVHQLYYRNLVEIGYSESEAKEIAAADTVAGGLDDNGEPVERPGQLSDKVKMPFANDKAARAANNGALPPDLSLMIKARKYGPDYVYGLITGYREPPTGYRMQQGMNYNEMFPGHQIAMPPPLSDGQVSYDDGATNSVEQMARDITAFLAWSAEPELEDRKRLGIKVLAFLLVLTGLLFGLKRKIWADIH